MVSVLASSAVDRGFESQSGYPKDYNTGICYFSAEYAVLRGKSKDWSARKQNNVLKCSGMSTHYKNPTQRVEKKTTQKNKTNQTNKQKTVTIYTGIRMN